jgi:glutaminyl-tRNA synthetase
MLEYCVRDDLDKRAPRAMCVLRPLKVTLTNYPDDKVERLIAPGHPNRDDLAERELPFAKTVFIDVEDFREEANKKYKRLVIGKRVRLRNAYVIEADEAVKNEAGEIVEVKARVIANTIGTDPEDGVKPKGVIHWVSAEEHIDCEVRLYDRLFNEESPGAGGTDFLAAINPESLQVLKGAKAEVSLRDAAPESAYQFEREGYFCLDAHYSKDGAVVFNRTISLRDSWAKISQQS